MSEPKRYRIDRENDGEEYEHPEGCWVSWEDYKTLKEEYILMKALQASGEAISRDLRAKLESADKANLQKQ